MATITSVASGNFNSGSTWNGGVVPGVNDVALVAAAHVVTITADVTCQAVRCLNTSGYFVLNDGVTLTANVDGGATSANNGVLRYAGTTGATIVGNVTNTDTGATAGMQVVELRGTGTLTINGNVSTVQTGVTSSNRYAVIALVDSAKLVVNGNVTGGNGASSAASSIAIFGSGYNNVALTINGNISTSGNASTSVGVSLVSTSASVTVTGTVTGGGGTSCEALVSTGTNSTTTITGAVIGGTNNSTCNAVRVSGTVTINGNVTGGSDVGGNGLAAASTMTATINGTVTGSAAPGVSFDQVASTVTINGDVYASTTAAGASGTGTLILNGNAYDGTNGRSAIRAGIMRIQNPQAVRHRRYSYEGYTGGTLNAGTAVTYVSADSDDILAPGNVRAGVTYAAGAKTGTCAVPPAASVAIGVPTDNTVGTGTVLLSDVATIVGAQIAAATTSP